jgi:hypothetical protein
MGMCWSTKSPKVKMKLNNGQNFQNNSKIKSPKVILDLKYEQNLQKYFQNSNTIKSLIRKNNMENENS